MTALPCASFLDEEALETIRERDLFTFPNLRLTTSSDESRWDICITAMTQVPLPSQKLFLSPDYAGWSDDPVLQSLMQDFSQASSIEEAGGIWKDIQDYCYVYLPAIVCGHYLSGYLYRTSLVGVEEDYGFYFYNAQLRN